MLFIVISWARMSLFRCRVVCENFTVFTVCPFPLEREVLNQINTLATVDSLANTEVPNFVTVVEYHHLLTY